MASPTLLAKLDDYWLGIKLQWVDILASHKPLIMSWTISSYPSVDRLARLDFIKTDEERNALRGGTMHLTQFHLVL